MFALLSPEWVNTNESSDTNTQENRHQTLRNWVGLVLVYHESPLDPQEGLPGRYINVRHCGGLSIVLLQLKDPLELFVKSLFIPGSGFLSRRDIT